MMGMNFSSSWLSAAVNVSHLPEGFVLPPPCGIRMLLKEISESVEHGASKNLKNKPHYTLPSHFRIHYDSTEVNCYAKQEAGYCRPYQ